MNGSQKGSTGGASTTGVSTGGTPTAAASAVGRVVGLWRYPVKSMGAQALNNAHVSWHGVEGDRRWAFVRQGVVQSGFPWLTLRDRPDLNHYMPSFTDPGRPDTSPTNVTTPTGEVYDVADPALSAELRSEGTYVIRQSRGVFDTFPLSLITTQTIQRLGEIVGAPLGPERFRPNLLVDTNGGPFVEDDWVGCVLRIGGLTMRVDKRDGRCVVINIDPKTATRDPAILRAVAEHRKGCLGVYGTVVTPGDVAVGDTVYLSK